MDLSSPHGHSVNDGISKELCSLQYTSVDEAARRMVHLGKGTLLAKMDIQQAYRNIPVAPEDRHLLGLLWENKIYIDQVLPFGLRSAPIIFSAVADALLWIMTQRGASWAIHYIDDFLTMGSPGSTECVDNMKIMQQTADLAGLPLEPSKSVGPATSLTFLGIEIDSMENSLKLPADKLEHIKHSLGCWRGVKACRKRDLLSLIGSLSHASKVVRPGRAFLRRLIDLSMSTKQLDHFIRLNADARSDIEWWWQFIETWNGTSAAPSLVSQQPEVSITADASGTWGCGAYYNTHWFQLPWNGMLRHAHISVKELTPIVIAAALWGQYWFLKSVRIWSDNTAAVAAINNNSSRCKDTAHLLRCLAFLSARFQCQFSASHIPGVHNNTADALSRNQLPLFISMLPQADKDPSPIPQELLALLLIDKPDWTSQRWTSLWSSIFPPA